MVTSGWGEGCTRGMGTGVGLEGYYTGYYPGTLQDPYLTNSKAKALPTAK